jgi:acyl-CoA thioesterase-1
MHMRFLTVSLLMVLAGCSQEPTSARGEGDVLLVLGDSLSAGYGIQDPETHGWVSLMEAQMRQEGFLTAQQSIVNASVSGETSEGGMARLQDLLDTHAPETVVIELGANDALRRQPMPALGENLRQMVKMSKSVGAQVVLIGIDLPGLMSMIGGGQLDNTIDDAAAQSKTWVVDYPLADLTDEGFMQQDRLHPTKEGQPMIKEALMPTIKEAMGAD